MAISDVKGVKQFLGDTATTHDAFYDIIVPAVDAAIKKYLDRDIESTAYTDYYNGNGTAVLCLNEWPVISVTSVYKDNNGYWGTVSGSFGSTTLLTSGSDYALALDGRGATGEVGRLIRLNGVWDGRYEYKRGRLGIAFKPGLGNIKVTYTAGYANVPQDLKLAFWQICAQVKFGRQRGLLPQSESLAEYSYALGQLIQNAMQVGSPAATMAKYRRTRERLRPVT